MRLRHLVQINPPQSEVAHLPGDTEVVFAPMEALADGLGGLDTSTLRLLDEVRGGSYSYFAEGDLLLAKVTPCFENGKKAIATNLPTRIGFATSEVHVVRVKSSGLDKRYLNYVFCSDHFRYVGVSNMTGAGGLRRVPEDAILNYRLPISDLAMQRRIADFLDRETAVIDQLVDKSQRFVALAHERWLAVLDNEILGLSYSASSFRPVVHPTISRIPSSWTLTPLKHLTDERRPIMYGIVLPGPNVPDGVMIVKGGDVKPDRLNPATLCRTAVEIESKYVRSRLRAGDLVIAIRGSIGDIEIVPAEIEGANLTQDAARIAPRRGVLNTWLRYALRAPSVFAPLEAKTLGAAVRGINIFDLKRVLVPTPSWDEQVAISNRLAVTEERITALKAKAELFTNRLQELRSALITAAVTGQIDPDTWRKRGDTERRLEAIEAEVNE